MFIKYYDCTLLPVPVPDQYLPTAVLNLACLSKKFESRHRSSRGVLILVLVRYMCGTPFGARAERGTFRIRRPFFDAERGTLQY